MFLIYSWIPRSPVIMTQEFSSVFSRKAKGEKMFWSKWQFPVPRESIKGSLLMADCWTRSRPHKCVSSSSARSQVPFVKGTAVPGKGHHIFVITLGSLDSPPSPAKMELIRTGTKQTLAFLSTLALLSRAISPHYSCGNSVAFCVYLLLNSSWQWTILKIILQDEDDY